MFLKPVTTSVTEEQSVLGWGPGGEEITQAVDGFGEVLCPWQSHNAQVVGVRPVKASALH